MTVTKSGNVIFVDMDGVIADFDMAAALHPSRKNKGFRPDLELDFSELEPIPNAIEAVNKLEELGYYVYFASTAPWDNIAAGSQKRAWLEKYFPDYKKRLILTHRKDLLIGDFLIDDHTWNGAGEFIGEHIHFGKYPFRDWNAVVVYINNKKYERKNRTTLRQV